METWVGLARNGMCVIHDMEWAGQQPLQPFLPNMKVMNGIIAPLQAAAVYFNAVGGAGLFATSVVSRKVMFSWKASCSFKSLCLVAQTALAVYAERLTRFCVSFY